MSKKNKEKKDAKEEKSERIKPKPLFSKTMPIIISGIIAGLLLGLVFGLLFGISLSSQQPVPNQNENNNASCNIEPTPSLAPVLSEEEAVSKAQQFFSENIFALTGNKDLSTKVDSVEKEDDFAYTVPVELVLNDKTVQKTYVLVTKSNGKIILGNVFDLDEALPTPTPQSSPVPQESLKCENMEKTEKPELLAFVVSYCPFGIQMQRIINELPAELKENIKVHYIGDIVDGKVTSMHGDKEAQENFRQICIREEQPEKYWKYVGCFIKEGKTTECLGEAQIDLNALNACMDSDTGLNYAKADFDLANQYNITGSPTLILNGKRVQESQSAVALGKTMRSAAMVEELLCCSFSKEPDACNEKVPEEAAARSFSQTYSESGANSGSGQC